MTGEFDIQTNNEVRLPQFEYNKFSVPENINLDIYLAPHDTNHDLPDNLEDIISSADIVVVEAEGGHKATEVKGLTSISMGDNNSLSLIQKYTSDSSNPLWKKRFYDALYGSKTLVVVPDIEAGDPIYGATIEAKNSMSRAIQEPHYTTAVGLLAEAIKTRLMLLKMRDQHILETVTSDIQIAIDNSEVLSTKVASSERVSVVMFYGGLHESLYDALAHKAEDVETSSVKKHDELAPQMIAKEVYDMYLRGDKIRPIDFAKYGLESLLHFINFISPDRDVSRPMKFWANDIYESISSLTSGKQVSGYRNEALSVLRSLEQ